MSKTTEIFGSNVFNDATMRERLPKETYKSLNATIKKDKGAVFHSAFAVCRNFIPVVQICQPLFLRNAGFFDIDCIFHDLSKCFSSKAPIFALQQRGYSQGSRPRRGRCLYSHKCAPGAGMPPVQNSPALFRFLLTFIVMGTKI